MKVAYLTLNADKKDGWGTVTRELTRQMPRFSVYPEVFSFFEGASDGELKTYFMVRDWLRINKWVKHCDMVHVLAEPLIPLARMFRKPYIVTLNGTYTVRGLTGKHENKYKKSLLRADKVVAISCYTQNRMIDCFPKYECPPSQVIYYGTDQKPLSYNRIPAKDRDNAFIHVGEVKKRKGTHILIDAFKKVCEVYPKTMLYIVGKQHDTDYFREIKRKVYGLNVVFMDQLNDDELGDLYRCVRGLVMPSVNVADSFEGFGLVHLEAHAHGTPSIGTFGNGNEEAVVDCHDGFLVDQNSVKELTAAMISLLNDNSHWNRMSENGIESTKEMSWEKTAREYVYLYLDVMRKYCEPGK